MLRPPSGDLAADNDESRSFNKTEQNENDQVPKIYDQKPQSAAHIFVSKTENIKIQPAISNFDKYRTLAGCVMIHLVIGTLYIWGGISPYVLSYLWYNDNSVTRQNVSLIFPFMSLITSSSTTIGVKLCDKFSPKWVVAFCAFMVLLSVLVVAFMKTLAGYYVVYMISFALFGGMLYMIPIKIAWGYFPKIKGTVSGLIVVGYGFGGFIFNFICKAIVNPDNLKPLADKRFEPGVKLYSEDVANNIPKMFFILFGCYTAMLIVAWLLIKFPHFEKPVEHPIHHHTHEHHPHAHHNFWSWFVIKKEVEHNKEKHRFLPECQSIKEGIFTYAFISMFLMAVTMMYFGQFMVNQYKNFGIVNPELNDDNFLTTAGSIASACNGASRLMWAFFFDKFGFRKVFFFAASGQAIVAATMHKTVDSKPFYGIWLCLSLLFMGCFFGTFPGHTSKIFGNKLGAKFYSYVLIGWGFSNVLAFFLRQFDVPFETCFWIGFGCSIAGLLLGFFQKKTYLWEVDDDGASLHEDQKEGPMRRKSVLNIGQTGGLSFHKISQFLTSRGNLEKKEGQRSKDNLENKDVVAPLPKENKDKKSFGKIKTFY